MNKIHSFSMKILRILPQAALIAGMLAAPILAIPKARGSTGATIEAPAQEKVGAGLVLLLSLQRT
ncbi:hypothetical protein [Mesorhizobium sp. KR1-2]|uniref:hypothetical protein n=1 Tax=Mesorhizobium sp. KR1-2 TaxID=3156609 RepID=UPI0032B4CE62